MKILETPITSAQLQACAPHYFGDMVKCVADTDRQLLAIDAELHSDLEALLLRSGSAQESLWGFNLYPGMDRDDEDFIEFDSLINIRTWQGNRGRDVERPEIRERIREIVRKYILP